MTLTHQAGDSDVCCRLSHAHLGRQNFRNNEMFASVCVCVDVCACVGVCVFILLDAYEYNMHLAVA